MKALVQFSDWLDRALSAIAKLSAWVILLMIGVTIFDVVTRRWEATQGLLFLNSTQLQELEWHAHVIFFAFCLGFAYLKDSHVRIDLLRERLGERTRWWIELIGVCLFLLPFCGFVIYFATDFTLRSFAQQEVSASATGLSHRWVIKAVIPIGFAMLALSGLVILIRKLVELFGPPPLAQEVHDVEEQEVERLHEIKVPWDSEGSAERRL